MANLQLLAQKNKKHIEKEQKSQGKPEATKDGLGALLNSSKRYYHQNIDEVVKEFEQDPLIQSEPKVVSKPKNTTPHLSASEQPSHGDSSLMGSLPIRDPVPHGNPPLKGTLPVGEDTLKGTPAISNCVIKLIEKKFGLDALRLLGGHDIKFLTLLHSKAQATSQKFVRVSRRELEDAGVKAARITVIREKLSGQFKNKSEKRFFPYEIICFNADKVDEQNRSFTEYRINL